MGRLRTGSYRRHFVQSKHLVARLDGVEERVDPGGFSVTSSSVSFGSGRSQGHQGLRLGKRSVEHGQVPDRPIVDRV
jgi:hypothetical protein